MWSIKTCSTLGASLQNTLFMLFPNEAPHHFCPLDGWAAFTGSAAAARYNRVKFKWSWKSSSVPNTSTTIFYHLGWFNWHHFQVKVWETYLGNLFLNICDIISFQTHFYINTPNKPFLWALEYNFHFLGQLQSSVLCWSVLKGNLQEWHGSSSQYQHWSDQNPLEGKNRELKETLDGRQAGQ